MLTDRNGHDKLKTVIYHGRRYLACPKCPNRKLQEITPGMVLYNVPLFCSKCRARVVVDIVDGSAYYHICESPELTTPETK